MADNGKSNTCEMCVQSVRTNVRTKIRTKSTYKTCVQNVRTKITYEKYVQKVRTIRTHIRYIQNVRTKRVRTSEVFSYISTYVQITAVHRCIGYPTDQIFMG